MEKLDEFGSLLKTKFFTAAKQGKFGEVPQAIVEVKEKYEVSDEELENFIGFLGKGDGREEVERIIEEAASAFVSQESEK